MLYYYKVLGISLGAFQFFDGVSGTKAVRIVTSRSQKDELINRVTKKAGDYEELSFNCAQGALQALQEEFNLGGSPSVLKAASWMPGLVSRKETCGALLGGLMALGLAFGRGKLCDPSYQTPAGMRRYWENKQRAWRFCEAFRQEFGSTLCGDIRPQIMGKDYDTMNLEELKQFINDGGAKKCRLPAEKAAQIAADLILEATDVT
jgi:C_GCAxxG_C_C family probable redox protein